VELEASVGRTSKMIQVGMVGMVGEAGEAGQEIKKVRKVKEVEEVKEGCCCVLKASIPKIYNQ
jgi:hypothetical protein